MFRASAARVVITPPLGTRLAGYPGRPLGGQHVYDDVFMRALVLEIDGELLAFLSADLMAVDTAWVDELRRRAGAALGIRADHLMVAASHTHSSIGGLLSFRDTVGAGVEAIFTDVEGSFDETLYELLLRQAISALTQAISRLRACTLRVSRRDAPGIASNRIHPDREVDPSCFVVQIVDDDDRTAAVLFHYSCHPTTLGSADLGISADFPGVACRIIENSLDPGCVALFLNGALGDVSTRFTRRSQTYAEVRRFGWTLGGTVLTALGDARPADSRACIARLETVQLAPKSAHWLGRVEERAAKLRTELSQSEGSKSHGELRQLKTALQGTDNSRRLVEELSRITSIPVNVQRLSFTPGLELIAVPGELFARSGTDLQRAFPSKAVRIVGTANGYLGYIPPAQAYEEGGYEVDSSFVEQGSAEAIIGRAIEMVD